DFQQGNTVHALSVAKDGTLSEADTPVTFSAADVPAAARLQGVAVVAIRARDDRDDDRNHGHGDEDSFLAGFFQTSRSPFGTTPVGEDGIDSLSALSTLVDLARGRE